MNKPASGDKLLLARLEDLFSQSGRRARFSCFLHELEAETALRYIQRAGFNGYLFYGGRKDAERVMLGVFPAGIESTESAFPITQLTSRYPAGANLTHRDFLGAVMGLKIARESIGDILISPGRCDMFVHNPVAPVILDELLKVGSFGVKTSVGVPGNFVVLERFEQIRGTVSSERIDCLVGLLLRLPREKASELIDSGLVRHNYMETTNGSKHFKEGDTLRIKGYGKFVVDEILGPTRKGRLPVLCRKYL